METPDLMQAARERRADSLVITPRVRRTAILAAAVLAAWWGWINLTDSRGYAGFFLVGAAYGVLLTTFEIVHARRRPGLVLADAPSGRPATAALRSRVPVLLEGLLGCYLVVVAVVVVLRTIDVGARGSALFVGLGVLLVVLTIVVLLPIVGGVLGRPGPGGVYLTADGIEHADRDFRWELTWDEVGGAFGAAHLEIVMVGRDDVDPVRVSWVRVARHRRTKVPGVVTVHGPALAVDPRELARLVDDLVARPLARVTLGTPASLEGSAPDA